MRTIPHTTSATERTLASTETLNKSQANTTNSQQRLQPAVHQTGNKMNARSMRIPSKINVAQSNQSSKLHWMANANNKNVKKYYPQTTKTPKGHLNQTRKNVQSTKPMETCNTTTLQGKKAQDVFTTTYNVRETMFSNQTGQFPTWSQRGNKYIMEMVKINSNAILVKPMRN
jgi:hypothetical protein